jgi:hypothetical protein
MVKRIWSAVSWLWTKLLQAGPTVLAAISAYYLFFVIAPFFLLGIHNVPLEVLKGDTVSYEDAMGVLSSIAAFILILFRLGPNVAAFAWLLSFANFCKTRNKYVLILLLIAALPIAYVNAGPYAQHFSDWIWGD